MKTAIIGNAEPILIAVGTSASNITNPPAKDAVALPKLSMEFNMSSAPLFSLGDTAAFT